MIEIKVPDQNKNIRDQVHEAFQGGKGLIVVASNDQNWNQYMSWVILNELNKERSKTIVLIPGDEDQYKPERQMETVEVNNLTSENLVFACAIRDKEKAIDVLRATESCVVVAIMHCSSPIERFLDMGIGRADIDHSLQVIIQQSGSNAEVI